MYFKRTLFAKSSTGAILSWAIEIEEDLDGLVITRSHGHYPNGAITSKSDPIYYGLAGRTIEEQAMLKANAYIKNKMDAGFVSDLEDAKNKERTNGIGFPKQMLARSTKKEPKALQEFNYEDGIYVQRKYNGYRCTIYNLNGIIVAYTRKGIEIKTISHILDGLDIPINTGIDGELYCHGWTLQKISSRVKKEYSETKQIKFMLYDALCPGKFKQRLDWAKSITENSENIIFSETFTISELREAYELRDKFIREGYEGAMLRTNTLEYECGKRSSSIWKLKVWQDAEFMVVDIIASKDGWAILSCTTKEGKRFEASAPGTMKEKEQILKEKEKYIGAFVNIEFPEYTPDGKPFQPVARYFREDF